MKQILILLFFINAGWAIAQNDSINKPKTIVGVDVFSPALSLFTDQTAAEAFVYVPVYKKWMAAAEVGYHKDHFDKNSWDIDVNGIYGKLGGNWYISQDEKDANMGYYIGFRLAFSSYQQTVNEMLIRGNDENITASLPQHSAHAYWLEPVAGGRVRLFESPFYIDASIHMKILLGGSSEEGLDPIMVPGFGENVGGLNFGLKWGIAYALPF